MASGPQNEAHEPRVDLTRPRASAMVVSGPPLVASTTGPSSPNWYEAGNRKPKFMPGAATASALSLESSAVYRNGPGWCNAVVIVHGLVVCWVGGWGWVAAPHPRDLMFRFGPFEDRV